MQLSVKFNGKSAASFTVDPDSQITATVPSGASNGPISVTSPEGTGTSSASFMVTPPPPPPPIVSGFSPTQGAVGTQVTISGSNFTGANAVTFNTTSTTTFTVNNDNSITMNVPSGATTGLVSVTTPLGGTGSSTTKFTVTGSTRIKDITFENGNITDPTTGFDSQTGTIRLETVSPLKGADSVTVTVRLVLWTGELQRDRSNFHLALCTDWRNTSGTSATSADYRPGHDRGCDHDRN